MSQHSQYTHANEIVEKINLILGKFEGYRSLHADGRLYKGIFRANENASKYSRAVHFSGNEIPVSIRFSKGGGDPYAHFNATVGMAVRFYLPDGRVTNLVMLSQKLFIANTVEQFRELLDAGLPTEPGGKPNLEGLKAFLAKNPNSAKVFQMRAESPAPISFANTEFNSIHAFLLSNNKKAVTPVRFHWEPTDGIKGQPVENLSDKDIHILYDELEERLGQQPVTFNLVVELAESGDPLNDATALWPEQRKRVIIGTLSVIHAASEKEFGDTVMNHDPTALTDGIDVTDDPIIQIRRGVYEVSAAQRSGGWHNQCPFGFGRGSN
ncbi:catalase family peroxidase [Flavobacterium sp.]|uniref:catalase family peroxidase n=1 Tax=Flavobacterium sp. TaxID=239 RepID=UPI0039E6175E